MRINHNIAALNTHRQLNSATNAQSKSMEKLSSGLRINRAGDDAAGLAISEKMRGQIRGLDQASKNAQDGISLIQTAEGALNETHSILQRMRELSVQSANDTNTDQDRKNIQDEMSQLTKEVDRVRNTTQFNTKNLIDGSMGAAVNTAVANENTSAVFKVAGAAAAADDLATALQDSNGNSLGINVDDEITVSYVTNDGTYKTSSLTVTATTELGDITALVGDGTATVGADGSINVAATVAGTTGAINGISIAVKDSNGTVKTAASNALSSFQETKGASNVHTDGSATFQIGANTSQNLNLSISDMGASSLGIQGIQVTTQQQADVATKVLDNAIQKVSAERSKLGATQNRLEHTINNLNTSSENLTAAESRVRDVDYTLAA
ncbi:flagellin N-terminal helical domain-containing protein [Rossellomorea marisflavi]|uniref:flagellin N-terminal helical domain-containing protein n=1 Tax=Rossellomorea marisflavi TaxID=189381 RepID=UPI0009A6B852|nr:flagellin [Rossellomorea marisflavi]